MRGWLIWANACSVHLPRSPQPCYIFPCGSGSLLKCIPTACVAHLPKRCDRKWPLGQPPKWKQHRQALTALKAEASGNQLKRGALKPMLRIETEPGVAIAWALEIIVRPLCVEVELDSRLRSRVQHLARHFPQVAQARAQALTCWEARVCELLPKTDQMLLSSHRCSSSPPPAGVEDGQPCELGSWLSCRSVL